MQPQKSEYSPASGLVFTHTEHRGEPARSRSPKKRDISRPLADSLEAQSPQSSEGGGRVFCGQNPEPGFCPPSSTRFAREVKPLPAEGAEQLALHLLFLRDSVPRERSGSDERARDQSFTLFQPYPLSSVCAKLRPLAGLKVEG